MRERERDRLPVERQGQIELCVHGTMFSCHLIVLWHHQSSNVYDRTLAGRRLDTGCVSVALWRDCRWRNDTKNSKRAFAKSRTRVGKRKKSKRNEIACFIEFTLLGLNVSDFAELLETNRQFLSFTQHNFLQSKTGSLSSHRPQPPLDLFTWHILPSARLQPVQDVVLVRKSTTRFGWTRRRWSIWSTLRILRRKLHSVVAGRARIGLTGELKMFESYEVQRE